MNVVSTRASWKARVVEDLLVQGDRGLHAFDVQFAQRPLHAGDGLAAGGLVDDQLADQRIVVGRDDVAFVDVRIEAHAEPAGHAQAA